jgi:hypothetical protein
VEPLGEVSEHARRRHDGKTGDDIAQHQGGGGKGA